MPGFSIDRLGGGETRGAGACLNVSELHEKWSQDAAKNFVHAAVVPVLPDHGVGSHGEATPTLIHFSRRSAIFRLECGGTTYAMKLWGPSTPATHTVEAAFGWLQTLRERDPHQSRCRSTRPVAVLPDVRTIVMEWVEARNLRRTIVGGHRERGRKGVLSSFAWLENFHAMSPATINPFAWESRFAPAEMLLDRHDALVPDTDRRSVTHALASLKRLATELKHLKIEMRFLHHDATCANFLFDGQSAIGIDLHEMRKDDPLVDYCSLLVDADALLNSGSEPVQPYGISQHLQEILTRTPLIRSAPQAKERIRVQLLSTCLTRYARRLPTGNARVLLERQRKLRLAEALASEEFTSRPVQHREDEVAAGVLHTFQPPLPSAADGCAAVRVQDLARHE